ncbi:MAG: penicillin-binding protein [Thermoleophilaceae bacterium]|nr:penicillin-binding protein [Thermoleophilaceae bacterium]
MNRQISILFGFIIVLFAALAISTSWWSVWTADAVKSNAFNKRPLLEQQQIPRGLILARDGTKLAINRSQGTRQTKRYFRFYPQATLFPHAVGYSFVSAGDSGLEKSYNDVLSGTADKQLSSFVEQLGGGPKEGDDLHTTLDPKAQREAEAALGNQAGAIVALEPSTGAVRVMAAVPSFDPNHVPQDLSQLNKGKGGSLLNRATQAQYPPGSTMKVVTSAAALDTGKYRPDSFINGKDNVVISGVPLHNYGNESFGAISLTDALTNSVNTVFGQVGERLGKSTMLRYMKRFGFQAQPPIDLPSTQVAASGVLKPPQPLSAGDNWDVGRVAIGQEPHLFVTPLQMAMVAAAVGNKGRLMRPHLGDKVVAPDGRVRETIRPREQSTVMSEQSASDLAQMMTNVVKSGTGTGGALQGIQVAGKTGTADNPNGSNYAWFIAFAPVKNPKVAVAVVVEQSQQSQTGGEVAAPIAARVMKAVLGNG